MTYLAELWVCEHVMAGSTETHPSLCGWSTYREPGVSAPLCRAVTRWNGASDPTGICGHLCVSHGLYEMESEVASVV